MNGNARDAILGVAVCGVIVAAMVVTHSLDVLWLLFLLLLVIF